MKTVFVVQNQHHSVDGQLVPKFDLTPAERFGILVHLLSPSARPFSADSIVKELHHKLRGYDHTNDHLLLLGNPALIGWAVAVAAYHGRGHVALLQWDGRARDYVSIRASLLE